MEATVEAVIVTQPHTTAFGTAALVLGILGSLLFIVPFVGLPLSIAAVVLSSRQ
jgi:VIT1/CCC1 family predicted Fe2+/Mn2+ transporter